MIARSHIWFFLLELLPLLVTARSVTEGTTTDVEGRATYSYYYISRKLYYIPLFFVVYWSFYIFWLIVQSISRHKIETPAHLLARRRRSIEAIGVSVMDQIERFHQKFLVNEKN